MQFASPYRPGIEGPPRAGAAIAAGVIAVMGFYGFATAVQKTAVVRNGALAAAPTQDDARAAVAVGPTPSLVYAVAEPGEVQRAAASAPRLAETRPAEPVIPIEQTEVRLAAAPLVEPAAASLVIPEPPAVAAIANAETAASNAVAVEPAAENVITPQ